MAYHDLTQDERRHAELEFYSLQSVATVAQFVADGHKYTDRGVALINRRGIRNYTFNVEDFVHYQLLFMLNRVPPPRPDLLDARQFARYQEQLLKQVHANDFADTLDQFDIRVRQGTVPNTHPEFPPTEIYQIALAFAQAVSAQGGLWRRDSQLTDLPVDDARSPVSRPAPRPKWNWRQRRPG